MSCWSLMAQPFRAALQSRGADPQSGNWFGLRRNRRKRSGNCHASADRALGMVINSSRDSADPVQSASERCDSGLSFEKTKSRSVTCVSFSVLRFACVYPASRMPETASSMVFDSDAMRLANALASGASASTPAPANASSCSTLPFRISSMCPRHDRK